MFQFAQSLCESVQDVQEEYRLFPARYRRGTSKKLLLSERVEYDSLEAPADAFLRTTATDFPRNSYHIFSRSICSYQASSSHSFLLIRLEIYVPGSVPDRGVTHVCDPSHPLRGHS